MLNDRQSLILCGILALSIFVTGIFNILDNFIVLTILTIIFIAIVGNLLYIKSKDKEDTKNNE